MTTYTTLVNVDADTAQKLATFIASKLAADVSEKFKNNCFALIEAVKTQELINAILAQNEVILSLENDEEVESCYQALFCIIYSLGDSAAESNGVINSIISNLVSDKSSDKAVRRLNALVVLFNLCISAESKLEVLSAILNYASETNQFSSVAHLHTRVEEWITSWALTIEQQRSVFKVVSSALEKDGQHSASLRVLTRYFQTFKKDTTIAKDVEELMKTAVLNAINSPVESFSDRMMLLDSFIGQKSTLPWSGLITLLKIICDGSLEDFTNFKNKYSSTLFTEYGQQLHVNDLEYTMKLLTLCSLSSQANNKMLTFQMISNTLKIEIDDVEMWIIDAIGQNLLEGSIDQLNQTFTVRRFAHRSFGLPQWVALQAKLRELRSQVSSLINSIDRSR